MASLCGDASGEPTDSTPYPIVGEFVWRLDDVRESLSAHWRSMASPLSFGPKGDLIVHCAAAIVIFTYSWFRLQPSRAAGAVGFLLSGYLCCAAFSQINLLRLRRRTIEQCWRDWQRESPTVRFKTSESGITIQTSARTYDLPWAHFTEIRRLRTLFILYSGTHSFHVVPFRAFASPAESDRFQRLLQNNIVVSSGPRGFEVIPL
jgi:hypothetical protein